jgi:hypothetical protein
VNLKLSHPTPRQQDDIFENDDGLLRYAGKQPAFLWPCEMKPGLWMHALSKMGALLASCNERIAAAAAGADAAAANGHANGHSNGSGGGPRFPLPPIFDRCSKVIGVEAERRARDAYWRAVTELRGPESQAEAAAALAAAVADNPFAAEPHALLAQLHLQRGDAARARAEAERALRLLCDWGTCWDKRMTWQTWVAWVRALLHRAGSGEGWPEAPFGVLNFGMVEGL